ncbi:MAG: serine/threonine-protein phosphatase [Acidobacteria bacterium]|nr:serine/threonine-protein phosphatase [Acidobacteriota bacterium]
MGDTLSRAGPAGGRPPVTGAGRTDTGPVRTANEDHWHVDSGRGLFMVADGMGGHQAGEVAAHLAVAEVIADLLASADDAFTWPLGHDSGLPRASSRISHALRRANDAVYAAGVADPALMGMGTTLTVLLIDQGQAAIGSVGDSRAYLVRGAQVEALTHDDTWLASVLGRDGARDAAARAHPMRHVLTSVIGAREPARPEVLTLEVRPDDILVLATDGLHNVVDDASIGHLVRGCGAEAAADALVEAALSHGTTDNVTVVVVHP